MFKFFVCDEEHEINDKEFDCFSEAFEYAQCGLMTHLYIFNPDDPSSADREIWSWELPDTEDQVRNRWQGFFPEANWDCNSGDFGFESDEEALDKGLLEQTDPVIDLKWNPDDEANDWRDAQEYYDFDEVNLDDEEDVRKLFNDYDEPISEDDLPFTMSEAVDIRDCKSFFPDEELDEAQCKLYKVISHPDEDMKELHEDQNETFQISPSEARSRLNAAIADLGGVDESLQEGEDFLFDGEVDLTEAVNANAFKGSEFEEFGPKGIKQLVNAYAKLQDIDEIKVDTSKVTPEELSTFIEDIGGYGEFLLEIFEEALDGKEINLNAIPAPLIMELAKKDQRFIDAVDRFVEDNNFYIDWYDSNTGHFHEAGSVDANLWTTIDPGIAAPTDRETGKENLAASDFEYNIRHIRQNYNQGLQPRNPRKPEDKNESLETCPKCGKAIKECHCCNCDDDDMSDEEFVEAFGKALSESRCKEELTESQSLTEAVANIDSFFNWKVTKFKKDPPANPVTPQEKALRSDPTNRIEKTFAKLSDAKEYAKQISWGTINGTGHAVISADSYKEGNIKTKKGLGGIFDKNSKMSSKKVEELFKQVATEFKLPYDMVAVYKDGKVDPKYPNKEKQLQGIVNQVIGNLKKYATTENPQPQIDLSTTHNTEETTSNGGNSDSTGTGGTTGTNTDGQTDGNTTGGDDGKGKPGPTGGDSTTGTNPKQPKSKLKTHGPNSDTIAISVNQEKLKKLQKEINSSNDATIVGPDGKEVQ